MTVDYDYSMESQFTPAWYKKLYNLYKDFHKKSV